MAEPLVPDVVVNVCHNCVPEGEQLPRQWKQGDGLVVVREIPCSGKIDVQYLLHTLEDVGRGVCVVACPAGKCQLTQGNCRAEVRVRTVQRLLKEIGLEPERAELLHCSADDPRGRLEQLVRGAARRLCELGPSPLHAPTPRQDQENQRQEELPSPAVRSSRALSS